MRSIFINGERGIRGSSRKPRVCSLHPRLRVAGASVRRFLTKQGFRLEVIQQHSGSNPLYINLNKKLV